jgi:HAD superfamily hydrolase (TIGR01509 family)
MRVRRAEAAEGLPPAVLFDMDDTLFDHSLTSRAALGRVRAAHPYFRRLSLDTLWREYGRLLESVQADVLAGRRSVDEARIERFRILAGQTGTRLNELGAAALSREYRANYQQLRRPVPGARQLLERLHGRTRVAVVSNNAQQEQVEKLAFLGFTPLIDELVVSEAVGVAKPDPRIFEVALERVGVEPEATVMVGDSWTNDVRGARGAGIRAIWFNRFGAVRPEPAPVLELDSYRSPARAERLLRSRD